METKLCRICGKPGQNFVNIFNAEGLKTKIETCLPIIVTPYCLLPDTICNKCKEDIDNYHSFIKECLQSIIILEAQYNIQDSCLKSKQRRDKGCLTDFSHVKSNKGIQTEDYLDLLSGNDLELIRDEFPLMTNFLNKNRNNVSLVDYEDTSSECAEKVSDPVITFDESRLDKYRDSIIKEIKQRKALKRKNETIHHSQTKICKLDSVNKRKSKTPQKINYFNSEDGSFEKSAMDFLQNNQMPLFPNYFSYEVAFPGMETLSNHVLEAHGNDMTEAVSSGSDKSKKKMPSLVKISDLKRSDSVDDNQFLDYQIEDPPALLPTFVCSHCPAIFTIKSDLGLHIRNEHSHIAAYLCGLCSQQCNSYMNLKTHLEACSQKYPSDKRYICQVCCYGEDNFRSLENHVLIHDFLIESCKKQLKIFDPADYVDINKNVESWKSLTCNKCGSDEFETFKEFSAHRRTDHSIYHCDLCNKFYGRNSHLWKHVNRLHKGHPSITCQLCYKTSASKYHLAQHFNKIHFAKRKLQYFDFKPMTSLWNDQEDVDLKDDTLAAPKEIDSTHNLYTNIITNYTPPSNEGDFKCTKCSKAFHKKVLLKKHKKNCRPKMQKDLLTRCKTCSRVFKDRQSLAKHLVNYHSEYTCEICSQKVQSKCEIVSHIRFQHPDCNLFCRMCKNILRNNEDMEEHVRDHSSSYICQFCGDSLSSNIKLKMHILSLHRKILSLSCGICLKLFENQHILKDHVTLVHKEQLTPFTSCPVCGKNYGSKWKTYDHLNKSHGMIFKACKTCLEVFNSEAQLQAHCDVTNHGAQNATLLKNSFNSEMSIKEENEEDSSSEELEGNSDESSDDESDKDRFSMSLLGKNSNKLVNKKVPKDSNMDSVQGNSSKRTVYVNSNDPSCCEICFKTWPAKKHLWQHYIRCHKKVAATVCGICLKTNDTYEALQVHLKDTHPTLLHGQGFGSNFICRICGRYHNASSKLRLHMVIHEDFDWELLDGSKDVKKEDTAINYESMIEQIVCSDNEEAERKCDKNNEEEEEGDDSSSDQESDDSLPFNAERKEDGDSSTDSSSSSFSEDSSEDSHFQNSDSMMNGGVFREVDSDKKSSSNEGADEKNVVADYCDLQNENEIESAVGSIQNYFKSEC